MQEKNSKLQREISALDHNVNVEVKRKIESLHGSILRYYGMEQLCRRRSGLISAQVVSCCVYEMPNQYDFRLHVGQ